MCIILYKPIGAELPNQQILENCFDNNSDGAGFMYRRTDGQIQIEKGFMTLRELVFALSEIKEDVVHLDLAIHFRWATQGAVNAGNCHPFPVSQNKKDLRATSIAAHAGLVHNGVIGFCSAKGTDVMSDTQLFVKNYVAALPAKMFHNPALCGLIEQAAGGKFVLMSRDATSKIGTFIADDGIFYSNDTYKKARLTTVSYTSRYDYLWGNDYSTTTKKIAGAAALDDLDRFEDYDDPYFQCNYDCDHCRTFACCDLEEREHLRNHAWDRYSPPVRGRAEISVKGRRFKTKKN